VATILAITSLLSLTFTLVSDSFLVELNHLRAFILIPERSVLRRNGSSAGSAVETMTIWALVRMKAMIMIISLLFSRVFLHDVVSTTRIGLFSFSASVGELSGILLSTIVSSIFFRLFVVRNPGFSIYRRLLPSVLLDIILFRSLFRVLSSVSSSVSVKLGVDKAVLVRIVSATVDGNKNSFLLGWSS